MFGMLRADHFVNDNQQGLRTRRKGWPRDASAQLGPRGQIQGYRDGRRKVDNLEVRPRRGNAEQLKIPVGLISKYILLRFKTATV